MPNAHWARILSCFGLGVNAWFPMQNVFPMFLLVFYHFLHDALNLNKTPLSFSCGPSSMCVHPTHWPSGYPPFTNNKDRNSNTYFHNKMPMEYNSSTYLYKQFLRGNNHSSIIIQLRMNDKIKVKIGDGSTREGSWNVISPILPCILEFSHLQFFWNTMDVHCLTKVIMKIEKGRLFWPLVS